MLLLPPSPGSQPDKSSYLAHITSNVDFCNRIIDLAHDAELDGINEASQFCRMPNHRGKRAQEQLLHYFGLYVCNELNFEKPEDANGQIRLISNPTFAPHRYRFVIRRGIKRFGKAEVRGSRVCDNVNLAQCCEYNAQLSLNDLPEATSAGFPPAIRPKPKDNFLTVLLMVEVRSGVIDGKIVKDSMLNVYLIIPIKHKSGSVHYTECELIRQRSIFGPTSSPDVVDDVSSSMGIDNTFHFEVQDLEDQIDSQDEEDDNLDDDISKVA